MGRIKRMAIILSVVVIISLIAGVVIGLKFSLKPISEFGVQIVGGKHYANNQIYEINRMTHPTTLTDGSTYPDQQLVKFGHFSTKAFDYDLENTLYKTSEHGTPDIGLRYIYDTVPCNFDGTVRDDYLWEDRYYETFVDGEPATVHLYAIPVKAKIVVDFTAHLEWTREWSFYGAVVETMHGEVMGSYSQYGSNDFRNIGGRQVKGVLAVQFWAHKFIMTEFEEEDYEYIKTAIIDVECVKKQSYWHLRSESSQWDILEYPPQKITYEPVGSGHYNYIESVFGDNPMYSTVDDALQLVTPSYDPSTWEAITLAELVEEQVYIQIPFDVAMGIDFDTAGVGVIKANSIRYVWKYEVELEFVYTILTGYRTLIGDEDNDDGEEEEEEYPANTIWEKILAFLTKMWKETWGKVVFIGIFIILPGGAIGIKRFVVHRKKKEDDGKGIGKKKQTKRKDRKK